MVRIHTIGGYDEVGKNMTAVETKDDVILFDMGLHLPAIVGVQEKEKIPTERGMRSLGALPDDLYLDKKNLRNKVKAIAISHAHLDHVGAVQYLAPRYRCPVLGTPFTTEVLHSLMEDNSKYGIPNRTIPVKPNNFYTVKGKNGQEYKIEFINMTHSTIQCAIIAVHTKDGVILYSNDFKLDNTPTFGDPPNYKRLKELSKIGVKALVSDCLYAPTDRKTPSEKIARSMLQEVLFGIDHDKAGILVTTFSSHIARLRSIVEFGQKMNREVILLGRSMSKYANSAIHAGRSPFKGQVHIAKYRSQVERALKKASRNKKKYMIVCTGHQGEPGAILDRLSRNKLPYKLSAQDHIVFSSSTIPTPVNEKMRADLGKRLQRFHPRVFDDVHVSGHGGKEDIRELINLTNPEHFIPSHGDRSKREAGLALALEMGYKKSYNVHMLANGKNIALK